jgi:hypothetical protein
MKNKNWDLYYTVNLIDANNIKAAKARVKHLCSKYPDDYHELGVALHALNNDRLDIARQMIMSVEDKTELAKAMIYQRLKTGGDVGAMTPLQDMFSIALKSPVARKLF